MMSTTRILAAVLALATPLAAGAALAGPIETACIASGRKAASRSLCGCIQDVADLTLDGRDQRRAAVFFRDPHKAQEIRQSDNPSNEAFWLRYKEFGTAAEAFCKG
jgi:hypothetical protein